MKKKKKTGSFCPPNFGPFIFICVFIFIQNLENSYHEEMEALFRLSNWIVGSNIHNSTSKAE